AIKVNGKFPVRAAQQGRFVQDGSFSGNAWQQFIPRAHIPQVKNPARGFVSSANQHSAAPNYPYYYIGEFDDYRGRILNRLLDSMDNITVKDMMALQYNSYSIVGEEAAPLILKYVKPANAEQKALYEMLQGWDYRYARESKAPVVVKAVIDSTMRIAFDELESKGDEPELLMPELWRLLSLLEEHPEHAIFD
ncbi:MAG: penicillin acylase family protein, partial [Bacteroidota bacterium]